MNFAMTPKITTKVISSTMNVALGTRKLLVASVVAGTKDSGLLAEYEDEQGHEGQVDEVHGLDQTDGQEEDRHEAGLGLGLTGHTRDGLATRKTVTDGRTDGAAA